MKFDSFDLGLRAGYFLSMRGGRADVERDFFIGIDGGKIAKVTPWRNELGKGVRSADRRKRACRAPGPCERAHTFGDDLFRGLKDDSPLHCWLFDFILPLEGKLMDTDFVRVGTEMALLESIRFGVTCIADMYFFPEVIADYVDRSGLRGWVGQVWATNPQPGDQILGSDRPRLFDRFFEKYSRHPRVTPSLAPHAPYSCDDAVFTQVRKSPRRKVRSIRTLRNQT